MKKTVVLASLLIFAFFISCTETEEPPDGSKTEAKGKEIDPLLIGDYWFEYVKTGSTGFQLGILGGQSDVFNFTKTDFNKCGYLYIYTNKKYLAQSSAKAYCKNGVLYSENDAVIFNYVKMSENEITNYYSFGITDKNNSYFIRITTPENKEQFFCREPSSHF